MCTKMKSRTTTISSERPERAHSVGVEKQYSVWVNLVKSISSKLQALIENEGGHNKYGF